MLTHRGSPCARGTLRAQQPSRASVGSASKRERSAGSCFPKKSAQTGSEAPAWTLHRRAYARL